MPYQAFLSSRASCAAPCRSCTRRLLSSSCIRVPCCLSTMPVLRTLQFHSTNSRLTSLSTAPLSSPTAIYLRSVTSWWPSRKFLPPCGWYYSMPGPLWLSNQLISWTLSKPTTPLSACMLRITLYQRSQRRLLSPVAKTRCSTSIGPSNGIKRPRVKFLSVTLLR
ncbi:hypothetical protein D3C80_1272130 [compost metagenome]